MHSTSLSEKFAYSVISITNKIPNILFSIINWPWKIKRTLKMNFVVFE